MRFIADREIALVKLKIVFAAIIDEALDGGFDQTNAAIIPVQPNVLGQVMDGPEAGAIISRLNDID